MRFELEFYDLERLIKAHGYDEFTSRVVADYLDEFAGELNLTYWIANTLAFNVQVFETKSEAMDWIEENLDCNGEHVDCTLYEGDCGVYLEY